MVANTYNPIFETTFKTVAFIPSFFVRNNMAITAIPAAIREVLD